MKLFFFDTETTWTMPWMDRIIQFWGIFWEMNEEDFSFTQEQTINQLINVDIPIPYAATAVHGIKNEDLIGYDYIDKYIYKFLALCLEADYVIGHNVSFDKAMLVGEAKRLWIPFDETKVRRIDTMKPSTELVNWVWWKWPKLTALHEFLFWIGFDWAHNAMADITATKDCFLELCKSYQFYENWRFKEMIRRENKNIDNIPSCNELYNKISESSPYKEIAREKRKENPEALKLLLTLWNWKRSVFLTWKAWTGKSTLMKGIIASCESKDMHPIILGSTGISALNIGGQTIHSFYAMWKDSIYYKDQAKLRKVRLSKAKVELIKATPFIIIDEISMVHSNTIDVIDKVMRNYLWINRPFWWKQMLFVWDIYQLPPVCTEEWIKEFADKYQSEWFFHSDVFKELQYDVIQLAINYRQWDDKQLSNILDDIRDSKITESDITYLNDCRYHEVSEDATVLYTHKKDVALHNQQMLASLPWKASTIIGETRKEFPENMKPSNEEIDIKVWAKVMMVTNDSKWRWVNWSIWEVIALNLNEIRPNIVVEIDWNEYEVEKHVRRYAPMKMNEKGKYEEKTLGTYSQFPLQLAYAITIHKSQGLTFEECIMNIENVFVWGQAYTALSRVKSLSGLKILGKVDQSKLYFDYRVESFKQIIAINKLWDKIIAYLPHPDLCTTYTKVEYKPEDWLVVCHCYDYYPVISWDIQKFHDAICRKYRELLNKQDIDFVVIEEKRENIVPIQWIWWWLWEVDKVVMKPVKVWEQLDNDNLLKKLKALRLKLAKLEWFWFKIYMVTSNETLELIAKHKPTTLEQLAQIKGFWEAKVEKYWEYFIQTVINAGYWESDYNEPEWTKSPSKKEKKKSSWEDYNKELYKKLKIRRTQLAQKNWVPPFMVFHDKTLKALAWIRPKSKEEMLEIDGIKEAKYEKYWKEMLEIIVEEDINYDEIDIKHEIKPGKDYFKVDDDRG